MTALTEKQERILDFLQECVLNGRSAPSVREICARFGLLSPRSASDHLAALERKGFIRRQSGKARSIELIDAPSSGIPLLGSIPAGYPGETAIFGDEMLPVTPLLFGISEQRKAFALRVHGDSMEGRNLLDGDIAILESGATPRAGDIVAALIHGECTLKTLKSKASQAWLQ